MLPIYSDLLKMWSDLGYDLPIKEGKYWLENNFIQAFTRDGTLRKLWKYKVFDDLHIEITPYHNKIKFLCFTFTICFFNTLFSYFKICIIKLNADKISVCIYTSHSCTSRTHTIIKNSFIFVCICFNKIFK